MDYIFRKWGEATAPCKDCALRFSGCHSKCPKDESEEYEYYGYAAFKRQNDSERDKRQQIMRENDVLSYIHKKRRKR